MTRHAGISTFTRETSTPKQKPRRAGSERDFVELLSELIAKRVRHIEQGLKQRSNGEKGQGQRHK
jgi:hypothetical protein